MINPVALTFKYAFSSNLNGYLKGILPYSADGQGMESFSHAFFIFISEACKKYWLFFFLLLADLQVFFIIISTLLNLNFWQFSSAALQICSIRAVTSSQSSQDKQF